jgi:hypothetical protein
MRKKVIVRSLLVLLAIIIVFLAFLPRILKNYLVDYAQDLTGRNMVLDELDLNIFRASVTLRGLTVYEKDRETVFLDIGRLFVDMKLRDLVRKKITLTRTEIDALMLNLVVADGAFNFQDLLEIGSDTATVHEAGEEPSRPMEWRLENILINDSYVSYADEMIGGKLEAEDIRIAMPLLAWDSDTINGEASLAMRSGGKLMTNFSLDMVKGVLDAGLDLKALDLSPLTAPLKDLARISAMEGALAGMLNFRLNLEETTDLDLRGTIQLLDFSLIDEWQSEIAAVKELKVVIDSLDFTSNIYDFDEILLDGPYILAELYDDTDNWGRLMPEETGPDSATPSDPGILYDSYNIFELMAAYIRDIANSYIATSYHMEKFRMAGGRFSYRDYTLQEVFSYDVTEMEITADRLYSDTDSLRFDIALLMDGVSKGKATIMVDPKQVDDMILSYDLENTSLVKVSPYSVYYVAYPIRSAVLNYHSMTSIKDGYLKSDNRITINDFNFGEKRRNSTAMNLPVKLAISLLKDVNGDIRLDIPVEGDLNDPKFKWWKVVFQILKNLVVKAVTAPYRLLADAFGFDENDIKAVYFDYTQTSLDKAQLKSMDALIKVLDAKQDLSADLIRAGDRELEGNAYAERTAKKKFYEERILGRTIQDEELIPETWQYIDAIELKDSTFISWLNYQVGMNAAHLPVQKKCRLFAGENHVTDAVAEYDRLRLEAVVNYLTIERQVAPGRIGVREISQEDLEAEGGGDFISDRPKFVIRFTVEE